MKLYLDAKQKNWQSDRRFSENYLNSRAQKGYGVGRIRQELRQLKGVSSDIIDEVLMESEIDWYEMAENLLRKKFPNYNEQQTPKMKQKNLAIYAITRIS
ncbi:recombination regulator RecX [Haemophilus influenzae]|uniref:Regulatory protein RecX n=1 Tax=Haemophilus influenzae TaxID=727 RepID=A0A2X1PK53_HAEIF|nr:recombination regulator RecX [Haemophilus influenzae]